MSPRGRGISHVSNAEDCEHLQTTHRQITPPTAMQCVRTPSRDYDHAAVRMNEIGEEKVKVRIRVRWSRGSGTLPLPSASRSRPTTILAVFDMSNSIESHLCPNPQNIVPRLPRNIYPPTLLRACLPRIRSVNLDAMLHATTKELIVIISGVSGVVASSSG